MQQIRPHHEEPLLDGNAQSGRYGEIIHDGSGQPNGQGDGVPKACQEQAAADS